MHREVGEGTRTSTNWSGAVVFALPGTAFKTVTAVWNIPEVFSPANDGGSYYSSYWIGMDGSGSRDVFQVGVRSDSFGLNGAVRTQRAWWEWYPEDEVDITNFPVSPGQSILGLLTVISNVIGNVLLINQTTGLTTAFGVVAPSGTSLAGNCAEWIVERPAFNGVFSTLADYGEMNFKDCSAGTSGGITLLSSAGVSYNMSNGTQIVSQGTLQGANTVNCVYTGPSQLWTAGQSINDGWKTLSTPAACLFNDQIHVFWKTTDGRNFINHCVSPDGSAWSDGSVIEAVFSTPDGLASCVFNNQLYIFWHGSDSNNLIHYMSSQDGISWSTPATINNYDSTPQALAACTFNNQLYVFWTADDFRIYSSASPDGVSWPSGTTINNHDKSLFGPTACVFNNKLFLFRTSNRIYVSGSSDGVSWPPGTPHQ